MGAIEWIGVALIAVIFILGLGMLIAIPVTSYFEEKKKKKAEAFKEYKRQITILIEDVTKKKESLTAEQREAIDKIMPEIEEILASKDISLNDLQTYFISNILALSPQKTAMQLDETNIAHFSKNGYKYNRLSMPCSGAF